MLEKLFGIDVELGMSYCLDDEDIYREILEEYVNSAKISELGEFYDNKDWHNYQVKIHAVKSTSLTIGAKELSAMALELETACKEGRESDIIAGHGPCMFAYQKVLDTVIDALND